MATCKLRMVFTGIVFLLSAMAFAAEDAQTVTTTRDWTATRQPNVDARPLPSKGQGSDFFLMDKNTTPLALGLVAPVQLPWGNWNVRGIRLSPIYGRCENLVGMDLGLVNTVEKDMIGLQVGFLNTTSRARGVQVGLFNCAYYLKGVQIGFINYAEGAKGLQIGVINVITNTTPGMFPFIYGSF